MKSAIKLYRFELSGHSHRVELMLSLLRLDFIIIEINLWKHAQKGERFLSLNPNGQVPVIDDNGVIVADSIDILTYLAAKYGGGRWLPQDTAEAAVVQHFMTDVAAQMMAGLVAARRITLFDARLDAETALRKSHEVLTGLEHTLRLGESNYMMGDQPNVADIAFYSYVYLAPEGRVSLAPYPRLRNWLFLMELLPNFIRMTDSPVGLKRRESIGC